MKKVIFILLVLFTGQLYSQNLSSKNKKAIEYLNRALNESSNSASDVKTYHLLGQCYAQILRSQEAVFYFSKALQLSKNFYDVPWMNKAVAEIRLFLQRAEFLLQEQKKRKGLIK